MIKIQNCLIGFVSLTTYYLLLTTDSYAQAISPVPLSQAYGFGWINSLAEGTNLLVGPAFAIAALAVTVYFIIGGLRFLLSGGDKDSIAKARGMITHAVIGFILLMLTFIILQFIPEFFDLKGFAIIK